MLIYVHLFASDLRVTFFRTVTGSSFKSCFFWGVAAKKPNKPQMPIEFFRPLPPPTCFRPAFLSLNNELTNNTYRMFSP